MWEGETPVRAAVAFALIGFLRKAGSQGA